MEQEIQLGTGFLHIFQIKINSLQSMAFIWIFGMFDLGCLKDRF